MASNGSNNHGSSSSYTSQYTLPSKELDWWSEDAMVRFGTNTQKTNEPAWQDVGANVLRMDSLYDASFHDWLKCEDNVSIIASYLQRIANEYPMDRIINALRWLVSSWRLESTVVIVRHITADWAVPQNPPKPSTSTSFLMESSSQSSLQTDPSVLSGEARRGVLVRELTKDWTCQQIAQLVGMLSLTFWSERSHLEAFLKTLVSDWDFCRLSSFFSYVSGQLGLDYRVKVSMLQQAARRNASRLSLKRARNGASRTSKVSEQAASRKENAVQEDEDSNKRARHESAEYAAVSNSSSRNCAAASADESNHNAASSPVRSLVTGAEAASSGRPVAPAQPPSASTDSSSSSNSTVQMQAIEPAAASANSAASASASASGPGELSSPARTGAPAPSTRAATSLSARAFRSGHMPAPLCTGRASSSHLREPSMAMEAAAAAAAGPATTPSSPAVPNGPAVSPPATASVHSCMASQPAEATSMMDVDAEEIQSSSSSTDLASMSYTRSQSGQQQQQHQQQRRRSRNNTSGASAAPANASSPLVAGAALCSSEPAQQSSPAAPSSGSPSACASSSAPESAAAASSSMSARRPLTPQMASGMFIVGAESHQQSSPSLRRQHRHNRSYQRHDCQQPLTPTHSSSSLSLMSGGSSAQVGSAQSAASSASGLPTRPTMRIHAASISTTTAESSSLLVGAASSSSSPSSMGGGSGGSSSHQLQQHQHQQDLQQGQGQGQEFRARTASESELGQFDGPASTHLALPLPSESASNASSLCGRTSAAPYDVLGIVMSTEAEHHQLAGSSV